MKTGYRMCIALGLMAWVAWMVGGGKPDSREGVADASPRASIAGQREGAVTAGMRAGGMAVARSTPLNRYYQADQLLPLMADLEERSRAGDADASLALSRIHDECAMAPTSVAGLFHAGVPQARIDAIERSGAWLKNRCAGMPDDTVGAIRKLLDYRALAAAQGNLAAQIEQRMHEGGAGLPLDQRLSVDDHRTIAEAVLMEGDGEAYMAMSNLMGQHVADRSEALLPFRGGTTSDEAAWMIAGCRSGVPCGRDSALLNRLCARNGGCGDGVVEVLYADGGLTPDQLALAYERADEIMADSRRLGGRQGNAR